MSVTIHKPNPYTKHLTTDIVSHPVQAKTTVAKITTNGSGDKKEEIVKDEHQVLNKGLQVPEHDLCRVTVGGGMTISLGKFEFARIDVTLQVPASKNDLNEAYEFASDWVSVKIQEAVNDAKGT